MGDRMERWKRSEEEITNLLHSRTIAALEEQDQKFASTHRDTGTDELLRYVREEAERLGHSPNPEELCGGRFIAARFGKWPAALKAAGLPPLTGKPPGLKRLERYKKEFRRQARQRRLELSEKKEQRKLENQKKSRKAAETLKRLAERPLDVEWVARHQDDTDDALLDYLRLCADGLGHTPAMREVLGGWYISKRFGNWSVAIQMSGLPFRKGMKRPKQTALDAYRRSHSV